jgi:hypothetical protein
MSLAQKVRLDLADGSEVEVVYDGRDLRAWEIANGKSALSEDLSLSMLTWLGWHAGKRENLLNGEYDKYEAFDAVCTSVQGLTDDARPTKRTTARTPKTPSGG